MDQPAWPAVIIPAQCLECERILLATEDREVTHKGPFCRACFSRLTVQLETMMGRHAQTINHPAALAGALVGAAGGIAVWWGFTVLTHIQSGLVALVIGIAVAKGMLMATGGRRSRPLRFMALAVSTVAYLYAHYLVTRTFLIEAYPQFAEMVAPWPHPSVFMEVTVDSFDVFPLLFLAIVLWQTWHATRPKRS